MNKILLLLLCVGLIGCAASNTKKYISVYNDAVSSGQSVMIIKEGAFDTTKEGVEQQLKSVGYGQMLYSSLEQECMVLYKDSDYGNPLLSGDAKAHQIILKYTKIEDGKTRIDLVNGGTTPSIKADVDKDIQRLAELIQKS